MKLLKLLGSPTGYLCTRVIAADLRNEETILEIRKEGTLVFIMVDRKSSKLLLS